MFPSRVSAIVSLNSAFEHNVLIFLIEIAALTIDGYPSNDLSVSVAICLRLVCAVKYSSLGAV